MRLIVLCAAALVGLALGEVRHLEPCGLVFGALVAVLGACLAGRHSAWRWLALGACALAAGALRASTIEPGPASALEPYAGRVVRLGGRLVEPPALASSGVNVRLLLEVDAVGPGGQDPPPIPMARLNVIADAASLEAPQGADPAVRGAPETADDAILGKPTRTGPAGLGTPKGANAASPGTRQTADAASLGTRARIDDVQAGAVARTNSPTTALRPLAAGDYLLLEGRLLGADSRGPPTLLLPRLLDHGTPQTPNPSAWLANLRGSAAAGSARYLPEPQASLATGVLLGGSGHLDADFRVDLQRSGLAHLVAIDGYKQVVVAAALGGLSLRLLGARLATLPILLGIAGYTLLTGAHPSAVRAALMVGLASVASATGRVADPLTSLLLAALAMAALEPAILLDVGLQLSLSATLGIVLLWPRLRRRLRGLPSVVAEPVGLTLAVTLATLPVTLSVFQSVSLVSPVAHILAVPLLPPALAGTALLTAVSAVEPLANAAAWLAWVPSTALVEVIRFFGSLPGAALSTGRLPAPAAIGLGAGLLAWGLWGLPEAAAARLWAARLRLAERALTVPVAWVSVCLAAIAWLEMARPDGRLHIDALSTGRGAAVFIRGPTGRTALVVAGRADGVILAAQVADRLAVWEHKLDDVLWLDAAAESAVGPVLARYPAGQRLAADHDARIELGGGAALDVYAHTPDAQDISVSFGQISLPLQAQTAPAELVSDGTSVWLLAEAEQLD